MCSNNLTRVISHTLVIQYFLVCVMSCPLLANGRSNDDNGVKIGAIAAMWQKRSDGISSVKVKWKETQVTKRPTHVTDSGQPAEGSRPQDMTLASEYLLTVKDVRFCLEQSGDVPFAKENGTVVVAKRNVKTCYDGKQTKGLGSSSMVEFPQGSIDSRRLSFNKQGALLPVALAFYLGGSDLSPLPVDDMKVIDKPAVTQGVSCVIVRYVDKKSPNITRDVWCDPQRQFIVLRYVMEANGKPAFQVNFDWKAQPKGEWVPCSWQTSIFDERGVIKTATEAVVSEIVLNDPINEESAFDVQFPIGTRVNDQIAKRIYIMQEDDVRRDILPVEVAQGISQEELLSSRAGEHITGSSRQIWIFCGTLCVVVVLLWMMMKKRETN